MTHPTLNPGAKIFEKVKSVITLPVVSSSYMSLCGSPSKRISLYGLSSTIRRLYYSAISIIFSLLDSGIVMPEGFWKSGIT